MSITQLEANNMLMYKYLDAYLTIHQANSLPAKSTLLHEVISVIWVIATIPNITAAQNRIAGLWKVPLKI